MSSTTQQAHLPAPDVPRNDVPPSAPTRGNQLWASPDHGWLNQESVTLVLELPRPHPDFSPERSATVVALTLASLRFSCPVKGFAQSVFKSLHGRSWRILSRRAVDQHAACAVDYTNIPMLLVVG